MFSKAQKVKIAEEIEKLLLSFDHPEMPKEKPYFELHVHGVDKSWQFADIRPNWEFENKEPGMNPWNERMAK